MLKFGRNLTPELIAEEEDLLALIEVGGIGQTLKDLIDKEFVVVLLPPRDAIAALDKNNAGTKDAVLFHVLDYEEFIKAMRPCKAADVEWSRATTKNGKDITIWCKPPAGGPAALPSDGLLMSEIALPGNLWKTDFGDLTVCRIPRVLLATPESANARFGSALRIDMAAWGVSDFDDATESIGIQYVAPNDKVLKELVANESALAVYAIGVLHSVLLVAARVAYDKLTPTYDKEMLKFQVARLGKTAAILPEGTLGSRLTGFAEFVKENRVNLGKDLSQKMADYIKKVINTTEFSPTVMQPVMKKQYFGKMFGKVSESQLDLLMKYVFAGNKVDKWSKVLAWSLVGFVELRKTYFSNAENAFDEAMKVAVGASLSGE